MPETNGGFPRPWDEVLTRGHPSLSSVQYMPANSTVSTQLFGSFHSLRMRARAPLNPQPVRCGCMVVTRASLQAWYPDQPEEAEQSNSTAAGDEETEDVEEGAEGEESPEQVIGEEVAEEEGAEPAAAGEEQPAAAKASTQMLARAKSAAHGAARIADPADWLQRKVKAGVKTAVTNILGHGGKSEGNSRRGIYSQKYYSL